MIEDGILAIHIAGGSAGLVLGPVAMRAAKRRGLHTRAGLAYHWVVLTVCVSAAALAALDWARIWWFLPIALGSYAFALVGYLAARQRRSGWLRVHVTGQGGSYIALVTALAVVNIGQDAWYAWALPTLIGTPVIAWVNYRLATGRLTPA